ncbi:MAG TPA: hypothetical protein VKG85_13040 [Actinomycetes bacterium]|nr:hypothetical protein [Actinomycetes bacterium]
MTHNALTEKYFEAAAGYHLGPNDLIEAALQPEVRLAPTTFLGRCLSRPVFLEYADREQLSADLENLHAALTGLPGRLFGGDLAAFARSVGMTDAQVTAIMRGAGEAPTRFARADFYPDGTGLRLMEINMGSTAGGGDNAVLTRAFLSHPFVAEFVEANRLAHIDTMEQVADSLLTECKVPAGMRPVVAAADWPASYEKLEPTLRYSAQQLAPFGIDMVPCHVGQLSSHDGRVWVEGRPVDVIYRVFMIEDLLDPVGPELIDPVLRAAERGEVSIFTPIDAELYGSKGALAMLSDEVNRHLYSDAELASLDRILPWTRMVRPGSVTVDGERVELTDYALEAQPELILKPTLLHAGMGVVPGWMVEPDEWKQQLTTAMDGPFVLQRRIRPVPELFPSDRGLEPWVLTWGAFLAASGYAGQFVRGSTDPDGGVVNMATGATATSCFHQTEPA